MASNTTGRQFLDLPPEMVTNILRFIHSKKDLKNFALVGKDLRNLAAPFLWHSMHLKVPKQENERKSIHTLIRQKDKILVHIRHIHFRSPDPWNQDIRPFFIQSVRLLLLALPKDTLHQFSCEDRLEVDILLILLQRQTRLKRLHLDFSMFPPSIDFLSNCDWDILSLPRLECLNIGGGQSSEENETFIKVVQSIVRRCPRLNDLTMDFWSVPFDDRTMSRCFGSTPLNLDRLHLACNRLGLPDSLFRHINATVLKELSLSEFRDIDCSFLDSLAMIYAVETPALKVFKFKIDYHSHARPILGPMERFLLAFCGLETINIDFAENVLLPPECFIRHGKTLRILSTHSFSWFTAQAKRFVYYSAVDLAAIVAASPNLEQLGIPCPVRPEIFNGDFDPALPLPERDVTRTWAHRQVSPNVSLVRTEFESLLETLAGSGKLHTLRMLTEVPAISEHYAIECEQFATQVLRFLAQHGSRVKVLSIWEHFHFSKARTVNIFGQETVSASRLWGWQSDVPECSILGFPDCFHWLGGKLANKV